jgi:hypothetical protein
MANLNRPLIRLQHVKGCHLVATGMHAVEIDGGSSKR